MNVIDIFKLAPVKPFTSKSATPRNAVDPALVFGLELETEGIPVTPDTLYVSGMGGEVDNSLRGTAAGSPWEYITKPATYSVMMDILERFFEKAKFTEANYSERCSVHVHVNVQDCSVAQLKAICFLYQVFERALFNFAGHERDKNIFCVPWNQTIITHSLVDSFTPETIDRGVKKWMKYTGLNLIPIHTQGTIEFRHLPGTADVNRISTWLQLLASLVSYGKNTDVAALEKEVIALNTNSEYKQFFYKVFRDYSFALQENNLDHLLELGVMDMKYAIMSSRTRKRAASAPGLPEPAPGRALGDAVIHDEAPQPREVIDDLLMDRAIRRNNEIRAGIRGGDERVRVNAAPQGGAWQGIAQQREDFAQWIAAVDALRRPAEPVAPNPFAAPARPARPRPMPRPNR